jgi:hypothetical protein
MLHYIVLGFICLLGLALVAWALTDRTPVKHAPCDCPGCEILFRPKHLPLKPERDRLAKGGHRA